MSAETVAEIKQLLEEKHNLRDFAESLNDIDLPAHPRALELELNETEDYLAQLYNKLISNQILNKIQKDIAENICDDIQEYDLESLGASRTDKINKVDQFKKELQQLHHNIYSFTASMETDKNLIKVAQEETTKHIDEIMTMEAKIYEINELVSQKLEYTAEEAKELMEKLTVEMLEVMGINEEKQEFVAEKSAKVKDLEVEVTRLKAQRDVYAQEAQMASNSYQEADKTTDEKYQGYKKYTELLYRIAGIEEIMTESNGNLRVVYAFPHDTELFISLDDEKKVITNAKTTDNIIPIQDLVELARKMNVYKGMEMVIRETLFRLKNKVEL